MPAKNADEPEVAIMYALIWGWLHLTNHRYGTVPSGSMQVTLTMILMNTLGYHPTVTELTEITGLAKSNVSRYVSQEMTAGFLEEYIDPSDRRRRKLRPTEKAGPELELIQKRVAQIYRIVLRQQKAGRPITRSDFESLMQNLQEITDAAGPA
jgi:DNA-binding MarR family transcriptional regulator